MQLARTVQIGDEAAKTRDKGAVFNAGNALPDPCGPAGVRKGRVGHASSFAAARAGV